VWANAGRYSAVNGTDVFAQLGVGLYQICSRASPASSALPIIGGGGYVYDGDASSGMVATGLSIELQDVILGLWVDNVEVHDGLHSVLSGSNDERLYLRGNLASSRAPPLRTDIESVAFVPSYPNAPPCSDLDVNRGITAGTGWVESNESAMDAGGWHESGFLANDLAFSNCCTNTQVCTHPPAYCPTWFGRHEVLHLLCYYFTCKLYAGKQR
jgi:hypothetical protein